MLPKIDIQKDIINETEIPAAGIEFEKDIIRISLAKQGIICDHYELLNTFRTWLPDHQPILEAGYGSKSWSIWLAKNGCQEAYTCGLNVILAHTPGFDFWGSYFPDNSYSDTSSDDLASQLSFAPNKMKKINEAYFKLLKSNFGIRRGTEEYLKIYAKKGIK
jgi:hypothetical protein